MDPATSSRSCRPPLALAVVAGQALALEPRLADGRLRYVPLGDMIHTGPKGYLDPDSHTPDGRSFLDVTAAEMLEIVERSRGKLQVGSDRVAQR